jgi:hypothetical protein
MRWLYAVAVAAACKIFPVLFLYSSSGARRGEPWSELWQRGRYLSAGDLALNPAWRSDATVCGECFDLRRAKELHLVADP